MNTPTIDDVRAAAARIARHVHRTPVLTCRSIDAMVGARLFFKCENFQKVGAFKARGAHNAVLSLDDEQAARGVATHSSGNHAAALALAARSRGVPAYVVMPSNSPQVKCDAVAGYGARITLCEPTLDARETGLAAVVAETGAAFVPPYDDERIIAGQGTVALELLDEVPDLDVVMTPIGGGGLSGGAAIVVKSLRPEAKMIAVEPAGADDAYRSLLAGRIIPSENPQTIADGLLTSLGEKTFAVVQQCVDQIVTVDDDAIREAMKTIWQRMKLVVEPSAAVPLAALLARRYDVANKRVGIVLSGGNVDLGKLPF